MEEYFGKLEEVMPSLPSKSVSMVFADLPYGTTNCKWDTLVNLEVFWEQCWRVLKENGVVVCTAQFPFTAILAASQIKHLRYDWVWEKTQATGGMNSKYMPMKAHENVLVFYKKRPVYNPQKTSGHVRKVSSSKNRAAGANRRNELDTYIYGKEIPEKIPTYDSTDRFPRSVLTFASDKQKLALHETQKPYALVEYFIKTYTNEGDTVLDPCRGSNTTGVVCDVLNRGYIGIEADEVHYKKGLIRRENPKLLGKDLLKLL